MYAPKMHALPYPHTRKYTPTLIHEIKSRDWSCDVIEAVTASIMSPPDDYSSHNRREACSGDMEVTRQTCPD